MSYEVPGEPPGTRSPGIPQSKRCQCGRELQTTPQSPKAVCPVCKTVLVHPSPDKVKAK